MGALQSAAVLQPTHVFDVVSQMGVAPEQLALVVHATHTRRVGSQTGVEPPQSALLRQATQRAVMVSQSGVGAEHCALLVQPMHVFERASHTSGSAHCGRSMVQLPALHVPTRQPATLQVVGLVQVVRLVPLHVPAHAPEPVHAVRGETGVPVTALHVPTRPGRAHASHWPLHAVSQQTPSMQLPERHCVPTLHVAPLARSLRQVFEQPSRETVLPSSHSSPGSTVPLPQPGAPQFRTGNLHTPLLPTLELVVRLRIAGVRELGR